MKNLFIVLLMFCGISAAISQKTRLPLTAEQRNQVIPVKTRSAQSVVPFLREPDRMVESNYFWEETIGSGYYDQQSGRSAPAGRVLTFDLGRMAAVWNYGMDTLSFSDLGTGYAFFDGQNWSAPPVSRIESVTTVNPTIAKLGEGEVIVASRIPSAALRMSSRTTPGSGAWVETDLPLPPGCDGLVDPKIITNGQNNEVIHILSLTNPVSQGGVVYQGQDGALVYQRSTDGGLTWSINGYIPASIDSTHYNGFDPGTYAMAVPQGDKLAFVVGDPWSDLFLMMSEDNGATWEKTVIWQHPIPFWNGGATDTIYCPDGSVHLAFDVTGNIHIVFGLTRLYSDGFQVFRFPFEGGIGHWQEGNPTWTTGDLYNCLNPDSLYETNDLIATHVIDWNGNGTWDVLGNFGDYNVGPISFPQIAYKENGWGILLMSSVVENFNNGFQDFRHILSRRYNGCVWSQVSDLNEDPIHMFDECIYPSIHNGGNSIDVFYTYQLDTEPGLALLGDDDPFGIANINFVTLDAIIGTIAYVNLSSVPEEGGSTSGGGLTYPCAWVTVEAHPSPGWEFVNWKKGNTIVSEDSIYTFQVISSLNIAAHFRLISNVLEQWTQAITISPNPADDLLVIGLPHDSGKEIITASILNLSGTIVISETLLLNGKNYLDVSGLIPGVYSLLLRSGAGNRTIRKVVIW